MGCNSCLSTIPVIYKLSSWSNCNFLTTNYGIGHDLVMITHLNSRYRYKYGFLNAYDVWVS